MQAPPSLSRRDILITGAAALPGTWFAASAAAAERTPWYRSMRRCAQHNFNEYDPATVDIAPWVDYWASLKLNCLVLTGGGFMAFYPTKLPNHHKSQFLGSRDYFGEYVKAVKAKGIRVVARIETNWQHEDVLKAKPDWFMRDEQGNPLPSVETPWIYHTCVFSGFHSEQVPAIVREITSLYDIDGIFTNSWPNTNVPRRCYCVNCRPFGDEPRDKFAARYEARVLDLCRNIAAVAKEKKPGVVYNVNIAGGISAELSIRKLADVGEWLTADHQGRGGGDKPIWDCSQQGRVGYAAMGGKPVTNVVTGNGHSFRHTAKVPAELELWFAQTTASGMVPWFVWMGGTPEDNRWREPVRKFYQWIAKNEAHFANRRPFTRLGVLYSQRLNYLYRTPGATPGGYGSVRSSRPSAPGNPTDYLQGMYYALLEGRQVFDFIHEDDLSPASLQKYSAIILPNIALLSDEQCRTLRSWVQGGGSILATFETSLYTEHGERRQNFGLADVLGVDQAGQRQGAFFYAEKRANHEVLAGLDGTNWLPAGEWRVPLKARKDSVLSVVPPYTRGIPEMVYAHERVEQPYPGTRTDEPALVLRENGQSRIAYLPSDIDSCSWRTGNTDMSRLLQNTIRWITRGASTVKVSGEGVAEVIAWETDAGYAIHILNYNNPNMTRPWIRRHYPIGAQQVRVELPEGVKIGNVQLLAAGTKAPFRVNGRTLEFTVPRVESYEIAALERA